MQFDDPNMSNVWTQPNTVEYLRYLTLNLGLGGLFTKQTPRNYIEGFNDPALEVLKATPVYMGGDQTVDPFLSIDTPPTHPKDNQISFFTGVDSYELTRTMGLWLGESSVRVPGSDYSTLTTTTSVLNNPWSQDIPIAGTDGMQFSPDLSEDTTIAAFVNDLSRVCTFTYLDEDSSYKGLDTMMFQLSSDLMLNMTANPSNAVFDVYVDGTTNLTSTLKAPAFASKGHFYQISGDVASSVPSIVNLQNEPIVASADNDQTVVGVEELSGVTLKTAQRIQVNFQIVNDELQQITGNTAWGVYIPLSYVDRNSNASDSQVKNILGSILTGQTLKWVFFGLCLAFGLVGLGVGAMLLFKVRNLQKSAQVAGAEGNLNPSNAS